jgi:hypothetical protein
VKTVSAVLLLVGSMVTGCGVQYNEVYSCEYSVIRPVSSINDEAHIDIHADCSGIVDVIVTAEYTDGHQQFQSEWANETCPVHFRLDMSGVPRTVVGFTVAARPHAVKFNLTSCDIVE